MTDEKKPPEPAQPATEPPKKLPLSHPGIGAEIPKSTPEDDDNDFDTGLDKDRFIFGD